MFNSHSVELLTRFARIVAADGYSHGLQPVQWQALQFLAHANRFSRTPKGLTAWLGQTKGSVSQTIIALEAKGLVGRAANQGDRRVVRVELTDAGRSLLAAPPPPVAAQMLEHLPADEQDQLIGLVEEMLRSQLASTGQHAFGQCRSCRNFVETGDGAFRCALLDVPLEADETDNICIEHVAAA